MAHHQQESSDDSLVPPSPSFITHSFVVPSVVPPRSSTPPPPSSPPTDGSRTSWPKSYEVYTIGMQGRSRPSPLKLVNDHTKRFQGQGSPTSIVNQEGGPFGTPPSTPGESTKSSLSTSSSTSSLSNAPHGPLPPVPTTPPPAPPHNGATEPQSLNTSRNARRPSTAPQTSREISASATHSHTLSVPAVEPRFANGTMQRRIARRERSFKGGSASLSSSNVNFTPPTSPPADRSSIRDTFSSPPIIVPSIRTSGASTPSTRPGSSKYGSGVVSWRLPSMLNDAASDNTYILDYNGVKESLQKINLGDSRELSMISLSQSDGVFEKDTDITLRPCTLLQGEVSKPWLERKDWKIRASWWITFIWVVIGFAGSAAVCYHGYASVPMITQPLCMVMSDDFDKLDTDNTWHREIDMGGFQNGEFEMTTDSSNNSYVKDGKLYIVPTLTSDVIGVANVFDAFTYNITDCTNSDLNACGAISNATAGVVINPIMSARLTTQKSFNIAYGKVEFRARMPKGDWIWPSIMMLPVDNFYGEWPRSGEIDLVETRGNGPRYDEGRNVIRSSLQWGPTVDLNRQFKTFGLWSDRRGDYSNDFHVYTLEWTSEFLRVYIDNRLSRSLDIRFNTPFFARGTFPPEYRNQTETIPLTNPWMDRGNSAPFDQRFYLIFHLAVGGTHGYFPDGVGSKPWLDASHSAMHDFALAQDQWYPTWPADLEERGLAIDYVKMWQLC